MKARRGPVLIGMSLARAAWGAALVAVPDRVLTAVTGTPPAPSQPLVLRILGTRQLAQAALGLARPTPTSLRLGVATDLLHAASCAAAVAVLPRWRRPALVDGTAAVALVVAGGACAAA